MKPWIKVLVIGLLLTTGAWFAFANSDWSMPSCPEGALFTVAPLDPNKIVTITPLGNISPPGHVTPTNHLYLNLKESNEIRPEFATPVYAPGDLIITAIHRDLDARGGAESTNDYRIEASTCKKVSIVLDHLNSLTSEFNDLFERYKDSCDTHTVNNYQTITYCHANMRHVVTSGTQLGLAGGQAATGIDLGVYDRRQPKLVLANPSRYGSDEVYTACGLDYFNESLKNELYSKLGRGQLRRTIEPRCGQIDQDVVGTVAGNWWTLDASKSNSPEGWINSLSFVHDNVDPIQGVIAHGGRLGPTSRTIFTLINDGTVNREFDQITPGEVLYCYEGQMLALQGSGIDRNVHRFVVKLPTAERLQAEHQTGTCNETIALINPVEYER